MLRRTIRTAGAALLTLVLGGCFDTTAPETPPRYGATGLEAYGGGLRLYAFESPGHTGVGEPRVVLALSTFADRSYCERLESAAHVEGRVITLYAGSVSGSPYPCISRPDQPASSSHFVDVTEGEHRVRVHVLGHLHEFKLNVTGAYIELLRLSPLLPPLVLGGGVVEADTTTFWRFPPRSLAFYCVGGDTICDAAAARLADEMGLEPLRFPPDGRVPFEAPFYVGEQVRYFTYPSDEALVGIRDRICRIMPTSTGAPGSPMIRVLSWRGDGASSWGSCG